MFISIRKVFLATGIAFRDSAGIMDLGQLFYILFPTRVNKISQPVHKVSGRDVER